MTNRYAYVSELAVCYGGPLDGRAVDARGLYITGEFPGRYSLDAYRVNNEGGQTIRVDAAFVYDPNWRPSLATPS